MLSVLIVEDHQAVREALAESFFGWGYSVTTAGTIEEAESQIAKGIFGLVLSDVDLGGVACLDWIRSLPVSHPDTALIIMSGRYGPDEIFGGGFKTVGQVRYLGKPFVFSPLQAVGGGRGA